MRISDIYAAGIHGINQVSRFLTQTRHRKQQQKREPDLSLRYGGDWSFIDPKTNQKHDMAIGRDFTIKIDHKALPGRIIGLDAEQLVFLDHYGFQLKVFANHLGPVEIYDESSNQTYPVINNRDVPRRHPTESTDQPPVSDEPDHEDDLILAMDDLVDLDDPDTQANNKDSSTIGEESNVAADEGKTELTSIDQHETSEVSNPQLKNQ
ncbi:DUF4828 domain-containing protein [Lapidilactobacillus luobeiensis]|uniref:DUF4828 domain-containing protein n=1 Tax=Lapidilactobacillus luobeiensis TaxID=2950371 RepID=UPI0021C4957C|nr:DUF4828 domain-containing protein [Lapidilactobacillus luobeiensis]